MTEPAIITVNGKSLTRTMASSIMQEIASREGVPPQMMQSFLQQGGAQLEQQAISQFIDQTLATEEAERRHFGLSTEEVDGFVQRLSSSLPPGVTIEQAIAARGMSMEQLREDVVQNEIRRQLFEEVTAGVSAPTDEQVTAFYDENPHYFEQDATVTASHVLIGCDEQASEADHAEARAEAEAVRQRIVEGADFADLAQAKSSCPSKNKGGDLGSFGRGQMVEPFEQAAFSLEVGEIGPVVATRFGYHVVKVTDRSQASKLSLAEVRPKIVEFLTNRGKNEVFGEFLGELREKATIEFGNAGK